MRARGARAAACRCSTSTPTARRPSTRMGPTRGRRARHGAGADTDSTARTWARRARRSSRAWSRASSRRAVPDARRAPRRGRGGARRAASRGRSSTAAQARELFVSRGAGRLGSAREPLADRRAQRPTSSWIAAAKPTASDLPSVQAAVDAAVARAGGRGTSASRVRDPRARPARYDERVRRSPRAASARPRRSTARRRRRPARLARSARACDRRCRRAAARRPRPSCACATRGFQARNLTIENAHNKDRGDIAQPEPGRGAACSTTPTEAHFENVRLHRLPGHALPRLHHARTARARLLPPLLRRGRHGLHLRRGDRRTSAPPRSARSATARSRTRSRPARTSKPPTASSSSGCRFTHDGSPNARAGVFKLARQWNRSPEAVGKVAILNSSHRRAHRPGAARGRTGASARRATARCNYDSGLEPLLAEYDNTDRTTANAVIRDAVLRSLPRSLAALAARASRAAARLPRRRRLGARPRRAGAAGRSSA